MQEKVFSSKGKSLSGRPHNTSAPDRSILVLTVSWRYI